MHVNIRRIKTVYHSLLRVSGFLVVCFSALFMPERVFAYQHENPYIVVDVASGKVLNYQRASDPWYPASVTKLMTLYVALQEVRAGRVKMDQMLTMSETAAKLPPSKMGFKAGTKVRLDNALIMIMVKSANDVAAMIAENLGGSEAGFAKKMNQAAHALGMKESYFVNAHGLPDNRHITSARDMAMLARAILIEFPEYQNYFNIGAIRFGKRVIPNSNGLIGRYPGADGMKTGFICSSGFNLVASAKRNGKQVITVVLGAPTARDRNNWTAELFDRGFSSIGLFTTTLDAWPSQAGITPPDLRQEVCNRNKTIQTDDDITLAIKAGNSNVSVKNANAYVQEEPEDHPSLAPKPRFSPVIVWTGYNQPGQKTAGNSDSQKSGMQMHYVPLPPPRPYAFSRYEKTYAGQDMEPLQLR
jgi:D-alanyl-D-alanine carboxypeptidase